MAGRADVLGALQRELWHARDVRADTYAAELERRIAALSQGTAASPAIEKASARKGADGGTVRSRRTSAAR